ACAGAWAKETPASTRPFRRAPQRRSVLLLQVSRDALDHALGLPDEAACVLVFDRLGDPAADDRLLVFAARGLERLDRGLDDEAGPVGLPCFHAGIGCGKRVIDGLESLGVVDSALPALDHLGKRLERAVERRHVIAGELTLDVAVNLFGRVKEMRKRGVPLLLLDQFVADQEVAA